MQPFKSTATEFIDHGSESYTFFDDPVVDALVQAVVELGSENWITRRRLLVMESVLTKLGILSADAIELHVPDANEMQSWRQERDRLIKTVYAAFARRPVGGEVAAERAKSATPVKRPPRGTTAGSAQGAGRHRPTGPSTV